MQKTKQKKLNIAYINSIKIKFLALDQLEALFLFTLWMVSQSKGCIEEDVDQCEGMASYASELKTGTFIFIIIIVITELV